jgi:TolB-like protein
VGDGHRSSMHNPEEPDHGAVRAQLQRVLTSASLADSPALQSFLAFIVEETLAGRADQIKGYTIAVRALNRPSDFDPQIDTIVRVQARRLRRTLQGYYLTAGAADPILIEIPRGSYVPTFCRRQPADGGSRAAMQTKPTKPVGPSVVVVPFGTLTDDVEQVYLADGLGQALVVALTRYPGFRIVGPLSRERLAGRDGEPEAIGRQYDGQFVLDGHFRRQGGRLRLTVRLVEVASGWTLWADTYDSQDLMVDLFSFEDEVANRIACAVLDGYGVVDAVLKYYHFCTSYTEEARATALEALERAVEIEPDDATALAMLADMILVDYCTGADEDALPRVAALTERALCLAPRSAYVRYARASLHFVAGERELFLGEVEQVLDMNPPIPAIIGMFGWYLVMVGEPERGLALIEQALDLNPHVPTPYRLGLAMHHFRQGGYQDALVEAERIHAPGFFWGPLLRAAALGELGRGAEAAAALRELLELQPNFARRGRRLMPRWVFSDENVQLLAAGLCKAGLELDG